MESINNSLQHQLSHQLLTGGALSGANKAAQNGDKGGPDEVGSMLQNFGQILGRQMNEINTLQHQADEAVQTFAVGGDIDLHNVVLATERADMALQLATQVRNRLIGAYQEISRMNV